ncbi:MAG: symmetrical bis(5'-nucleosyl)-tetraphosphatase [Nevskiaceae bacterium]|nr:symmetrical bis(5'-nucleosyl)-tetraphosphatase [Nevskiaceae bacterium]
MARYAIGDVQGCGAPLRALLRKLRFSADRDELWFTGDLVNRGPQSLEVLRLVRALSGNARTVLGNHDLHLLAHHFDPARPLRAGDTLQQVLQAPDREALMHWLLEQPLVIHDPRSADFLVHAGLLPQWTLAQTKALADETSQALRADPAAFLVGMYGAKPDRWSDSLTGMSRWRFTINVLTRLRYCDAAGTLNLKRKDSPDNAASRWRPWFEHRTPRSARTRVIFGHWSTLGLLQRPGLLGLDTGCVWGGALTAINLDDPEAPPMQLPCRACQQPGVDPQ